MFHDAVSVGRGAGDKQDAVFGAVARESCGGSHCRLALLFPLFDELGPVGFDPRDDVLPGVFCRLRGLRGALAGPGCSVVRLLGFVAGFFREACGVIREVGGVGGGAACPVGRVACGRGRGGGGAG